MNSSSHWMGEWFQLYLSNKSNLYRIVSRHPSPVANLHANTEKKHEFQSLVVVPRPEVHREDVSSSATDSGHEEELMRCGDDCAMDREDGSCQKEYATGSMRNVHSQSDDVLGGDHDGESADCDADADPYYPLVAAVYKDTVSIFSLQSLTWLHEIKLDHEVLEVQANKFYLVVRTKHTLYWFKHMSTEYSIRFSLYPDINCFSVSHRWIAYSSNAKIRNPQMDLSDYQKTLTKLSQNIAQFTTSGFKYLSESIRQHTSPKQQGETRLPSKPAHELREHSGTVEIRDMLTKKVVAHFRAHKNPVCAMQFDSSGSILVTSSTKGTDLNVYRIAPSISGKTSHHNIIHMYTLERGFTSARITSISFSLNSKWVAVASNHGTAHVFAINPHGGLISTHTHQHLVSPQMNDSARLEYMHHTKHIYCTPLSRIRSEELGDNGNEPLHVAFYPFSPFSPSQSQNRQTLHEQLYVMSENGYTGLFSLTPLKEKANDQDEDILSLDIRRIDSSKLEKVQSNVSVSWEETRTDRQKASTEDDEGEWISNLEIETYNPQERAWVSGQFRFVQLKQPIVRENFTDPNLDGDAINVRFVQMYTPTKPLDWRKNQFQMDENSVTAVDSKSLDWTPKPSELDASYNHIKLPPSRGKRLDNKTGSMVQVENYFSSTYSDDSDSIGEEINSFSNQNGTKESRVPSAESSPEVIDSSSGSQYSDVKETCFEDVAEDTKDNVQNESTHNSSNLSDSD